MGKNEIIQATGGGNMSSGGFAARAQAAGDRNANTNAGSGRVSYAGPQSGGAGADSGNQQTCTGSGKK
ncbi:Uu.00g000460.m01.CDS01 [Anthostomella pinea]|uniref:Uu.00g000460.m01.CDS01 n=1 Tax=Anthostomella pinea TaxID=933095 RepID=A0AAI8VJT8_9PEZI|nr:Uu.00g000460.m01.CDS01 [Anthostomella pinea]